MVEMIILMVMMVLPENIDEIGDRWIEEVQKNGQKRDSNNKSVLVEIKTYCTGTDTETITSKFCTITSFCKIY